MKIPINWFEDSKICFNSEMLDQHLKIYALGFKWHKEVGFVIHFLVVNEIICSRRPKWKT